jgi:hypothetical protein
MREVAMPWKAITVKLPRSDQISILSDPIWRTYFTVRRSALENEGGDPQPSPHSQL